MALIYADGVYEYSTTTGTTRPYVLAGPMHESKRFNTVCTNSDEVFYEAKDGINWERGKATYSSNTLTPTQYIDTSNADAAVDWPSTIRPMIRLIEQPLDLAATIRDFSPANVLHWGHTAYPVTGYGWQGGPNAYIYGDAGDTDSDVSMIARVAGDQRWEWGMVGDITDTVHHQSWHLKEVAGTYPSETFVSRIIAHEPRSPRYPFIDIYAGATADDSYFRVYPGGSNGDAALILGTATYGYPGRVGEGLTVAWEPAIPAARITSATWNAYYRQLIFEANRMRFLTGPVNLVEAMEFTNKGAVNLGSPIQKAASATISNSGQAGLDDMADYVPGVDVLTPVGGTGTAPTFNLTETQVSRVVTVVAAGTGGTTSTSTTLSAAAAQGASTVTVASSAGFANGDTVLLLMTSGYYHRTTITVSGTTWTLGTILDGACASGANVYKEQTVQGTTGTGTKATFSVRIAAGGIAAVLYIQGGTYTANPTTLTNEPVTGAGLTGAALSIKMGAKTVTLATAGSWTATPDTPIATTSSGAGTGATLDITYENALGTLNAAVAVYDNGTAPTGDLASGYVRKNNATLVNPTFSGTVSVGGFTAGSVIFAGSSGALNQDNANFFWDDSSNRLGIGTVSPQGLFHVLGSFSTAYASNTLSTGPRVIVDNPDTTTENFSRLAFASRDTGGTLRYGGGVTAVFTARTGTNVTADVVVQTVTAGVASEAGRFSDGNLGLGGTPSQRLDVINSSSAVYVAATIAAGSRMAITNTNTTNNNTAKLLFAANNDGAAVANVAAIGAMISSHAAGAETAAITFQHRVGGANRESGRFTTAGLFSLGGGETASFPALKRSSTELQVRLADDSAYAPLASSKLTVDNAAAGQALIALKDGGTAKFDIFKGTDNSFNIYDNANAKTAFLIGSSGAMQIGETGVGGVGICTTDNPGTNNLLVAGSVTARANLAEAGLNGQEIALKHLTELTTIAAAATTDTTIQIPAFAKVIAVSVRVTTVIPTATAFDVGVAGATTRYGAGLSTAANTAFPGTTDDGARYYGAAASIRITPNLTPANNTGRVRVTIHYLQVTAPTS